MTEPIYEDPDRASKAFGRRVHELDPIAVLAEERQRLQWGPPQ